MIIVGAAIAFVTGVMTLMVLTQAGRRQLGAIIAMAITWMMFVEQHLAPAIAAETMASLVTAFDVLKPSLFAAAAVMLKELTGQEVDIPALWDFTHTDRYMASNAAGAFDGVAGGVAAAIAPPGEMTPDAGMGNLKRLFGVQVGASLQSWLMGIIADTASLGHFRAVSLFHDAVEQGLGFQRLGYAMWRGPIQQAVTLPLQRLYQQTYTFGIPSAPQTITGWYNGTYTDDEMLTLLQAAGYNHQRATELVNIHQRTLTPAEFEEALKQGLVDETALAPILQAERLLGPRAALVQQVVLNRRTQAELDRIATTARELYKQGDLDEDTYGQYLSAAHWRGDEIQVALTADQLELRRARALTLAELHQLLAAKLITPDDYRARLTKMHYASADIDLLLAQGAKKLSPHQIAVALTQGKLTEEAAQADLVALGYSADDAAAFLALHGKHLSEGQVLEALRNGLVTMDQARADLQQLGFDAAQVDLLLAFQRKVLSPAEIQAAQLHGTITAEEATARLRALGYSAEDASIITDLRVRLLSEGQILQAYGDALIPRNTALADLVARGLSQDEAQTVVTVFDRKQAAAAAKRQAAAAAAFAKAVAAEQKAGGTPPTPAPGA